MSDGADEFVIEARGLTQRNGSGALLDEISFHVKSGEIYCLTGSTDVCEATIGALAGVRRPDGGRGFVAGHDVQNDPQQARRAATHVTRHVGFHPGLTARRNVIFFVATFGGSRPAAAAIENSMRRVGVPERCFDQGVASLPADVALRLWFAVALLRQTPAVLLDEPTAGLDSRACSEVQDALFELRRDGKAILIATSDLSFGVSTADRIGVVRNGRKAAERRRADLTGSELTQFYLDYVGRPPVSVRHNWRPEAS